MNVKPSTLINYVNFMCELIENHEYVQDDLNGIKELKGKILKSDNIEELINRLY